VLPKPLMPIGEFPILEVIVRQLARCGFDRITMAVNHQAELIKAFFQDGGKWGLRIDYSLEDKPLGTMGPLRLIGDLPRDFLVMNGDILTDLDFGAVLDGHASSRAPLTIATYARQVNVDFGVLEISGDRVIGFHEKPTLSYSVSMGVYGLSRATLATYPANQPLGFDELVLDLLAAERHPVSLPFDGYWLDIGRPDDYDRANLDFVRIRDQLLPTS